MGKKDERDIVKNGSNRSTNLPFYSRSSEALLFILGETEILGERGVSLEEGRETSVGPAATIFAPGREITRGPTASDNLAFSLHSLS